MAGIPLSLFVFAVLSNLPIAYCSKKCCDFLNSGFHLMVILCYTFHSMSLRWYGLDVVILIHTKRGTARAIFVAINIDFSRLTGAYAPAKFE